MRNTESRSLPSWITGAYEELMDEIEDPQGGFQRDRARDLLLSHEDFEDEQADAEYALKRLLERGWFYEVDGKLFVTEPKR